MGAGHRAAGGNSGAWHRGKRNVTRSIFNRSGALCCQSVPDLVRNAGEEGSGVADSAPCFDGQRAAIGNLLIGNQRTY
jgi:hypothetical protein